ncbi:MAG: NAD-dependent epimerase/dehydratase family protein [Corynebacterium sp.]|uniref:NAD-dependent epimerase/dehydratase family protein n=1 Tax=Corynebacterium sp. TaxID=1720 RepID=UPI0026DF81D4|nr:NAD-dependent epimerase/dehydratase family protein [Corynebacterium sp.]MDO5668900.1 NAD-dependent epimerase/dehydratase family protein [Corynebacterium sp.]
MTQTILGASGQIAVELARELHRQHTDDIRLVSRSPRALHPSDTVVAADLLNAGQAKSAVAGSDIVYFTAGLPPQTELWEQQFPTMLRNSLDAAREAGAAFAYFDNTYMYPQDDRVQTEGTPFAPVGRKGRVRADMADMVLAEMERGEIPVLIARAPEFYGPGRTQSFTNTLVIERLRAGKRALVPVSADHRRSLIWTPDASRALAVLANTPGAYGRTWHLPVDDTRPTYREIVGLAAEAFGADATFTVVPTWAFRALGVVSPEAREIRELLPRYGRDNLFDDSAFRTRFPEFQTTSFSEGLGIIAREA